MIEEHNKRIAKNTLLLYVRMLITMLVSLYTSRIVLNTLGAEDYGIYSVVGGVIIMFSFLNNTLSGATSRFLTYELGKNNLQKLQKVFSSALFIHVGLAFLILLLAETIGLWFLENKMVIPETRMHAARIVYQFSVISAMITITQVPYNALIIAHERMGIYAYVSILETTLKLAVVYILILFSADKLILYAILVFIVTLFIAIIYRVYCLKKFEECRGKFFYDKKIVNPILSFSSWDLYGNMSVMARGQGINILLNLFFGPVINAASGIATQVQNVVSGFADNFLVAVKPQIVKKYALGQMDEMWQLVFNSAKYSFVLLYLVSLPLIIESSFIMQLWLGNVPPYTVLFCQLCLINNLFAVVFRPMLFTFHAGGKIKTMSIVNGTLFILVLPISYILFRKGLSPEYPYFINIFLIILVCISDMFILKKIMPSFAIKKFVYKVICLCGVIAFISALGPLLIVYFFSASFFRLILVTILSSVSILILTLYIGMNRATRQNVICVIKRKIYG